MTDAVGRQVSFTYDAAGRVLTQTLPDARVIQFAYDANGNVTSLVPPGRPAHTFPYTPIDLAARYTPPAVAGTGSTQYTYTLDKQVTAIERPDGQTTAFGYNPGGQLTSVTFSRGMLGYAYDTAGRLQTLTDPGGVGLTYTYDASLPLTEQWTGPVSGTVTRTFTADFRVGTEQVASSPAVAFTYDGDGLVTQAGALEVSRDPTTGLVTGTFLDQTTEILEYNTLGELSRQTAQMGGAPVFDVAYTRDGLGRITQRVEQVDEVTRVFEYTYDLAGRLQVVRRNGAVIIVYAYDANGNRVQEDGEAVSAAARYDDQDRLLTYGSASYTHTANGELATKTEGGQTTSYTYDTLRNLLRVERPDGVVVAYQVDGRGRRVAKLVNDGVVRRWLYADQLRPIAEVDAAGEVVARFVYGARPNVPEYIVRGGATYRVFADHLGSPSVIVDAATGEVVQRLDYDAFGRVVQDTNPGWQPFGFAGGLYDPETGLVRFGARDYDAPVGSWTSKDPLILGRSDINRYVYAFADPLNWRDENGLWGIPGAVFGMSVGAVTGDISAAAAGGDTVDVVAGAIIGGVTGAIMGAVNPGSAGVAMLQAARLGAAGSIVGQEISNVRGGRSMRASAWATS